MPRCSHSLSNPSAGQISTCDQKHRELHGQPLHGTAPADARRLLPARSSGQSLPKGASQRGNLPPFVFLLNRDRIRRFVFLRLLHPAAPVAVAPRQEQPPPTAHTRRLKASSPLCLSALQTPLRVPQSPWSLNKVFFVSSAGSFNSRREAQPIRELPRHAQHLSPPHPAETTHPRAAKQG